MNKDDATELLPCPFCGSTASFTEDNSPIRDNKTVWLVGCDSEDCPAMPLLCGNARKVDAAKAWNSRTASVDRKAIAVEVIRSAPKHKFWGAGEPDCPREIKAPNGELHTLRCKNCDNPRFPVCLGFWEVNNAR